MTRPIFFLTDFGTADTYVGIVKAVILGIAPDARIIDLTHEVPAQNVRAGAFALLTAAPYVPADAVVLGVVDPDVGTTRRPIAVQAGRQTFVGPDNGLFSWALAGRSGCSAMVLDRPQFWLPAVSATFHGRDLFGPVAAHLAHGVPLAEVGSPCDAPQTIPLPVPRRTLDAAGRIREASGEVIHIDRYGNLITSLTAADLPKQPIFQVDGPAARHTISGLSLHFQAGGAAQPLALIGSAGLLEIAVPNGSAASTLGVGIGATVTVMAASVSGDPHPPGR